ncbi:MAG: helix-turn-helix domain-containing protein [Alphaproteobacteria bacterium]
MAYMLSIGLALKKARKLAGISQNDLGQQLGVPQSHISVIETGKVDPRMSSVHELSSACNCQVMIIPNKFYGLVKNIIEEKDTNAPLWALDEEED